MAEIAYSFAAVRDTLYGLPTTPVVNGFSEFLKTLASAADEASKGVISNARAYERTADALFADYQRYSQNARQWAERALGDGNARKAELFTRYADTFSNLAQERYSGSAEQWVKGQAAKAAEVARKAAFEAARSVPWLAKAAGPLLELAQAYDGLARGDWNQAGRALAGMAYGFAFAELTSIAILFFLGAPVTPWGVVLFAAGVGLASGAGTTIGKVVWDRFTDAVIAIYRRDPLTLDLDGDGLETVGANGSNILFDHDGDGILTGTGWVLGDDGFLVLDRNGNGAIDSGLELFGDSTPLASGGNARDGFEALAQEDTNGDGIVSAADARWDDLRVWRDANQDGVSQAEELLSLSSLGIASLRVAATEHSRQLPNGNQIADLGTYTRADGSSGTLGEVGQLADIDLAEDTFHRQFTDSIPLAEGVTDLPNMQASGKVRDLWEAASLSTSLKDTLTLYSQAGSRETQLELLDTLLLEWAGTAGLPDVYARAAALTGENQYGANPHGYVIRWASFGGVGGAQHQIGTWSDGSPVYDSAYAGLIQHWEQRFKVLEAFNGRPYFVFPGEPGVRR